MKYMKGRVGDGEHSIRSNFALIGVPGEESIVCKKAIVEENGGDIFQNCWDVKATDSKDFLQTPSIS